MFTDIYGLDSGRYVCLESLPTVERWVPWRGPPGGIGKKGPDEAPLVVPPRSIRHRRLGVRRSVGSEIFLKRDPCSALTDSIRRQWELLPAWPSGFFLFFQGVSEHADGRAPKGWGSGRMGQRAKGSTAVDRQASRGGGVEERRQGPTFVRQTAQRTVRARKTKLGVGSTRVSESGTLLAGLDVIGGRAGAYHAITPSHA